MSETQIFFYLAGKTLLFDLEYEDIELAKQIELFHHWEFIRLIIKYPKRERIEPRFSLDYTIRIRKALLQEAQDYKVGVK